jgi:NADPH:quinone reductase-like Zn-dependent oxidoreductase
MQAIVYHRYGSPDVLQCEEIDQPGPGEGQVLIKVRASSVNPMDCGEIKGVPFIFRALLGLHKLEVTRPGRLGVDVAGEVVALGRNVMQLKPGDEVFGVCVSSPHTSGLRAWVHCQGAFAEYVSVPEATLAPKPKNVTFEQAAAVPLAALTALQGLRDKGHVQPEQNVLIHGAGGGVGTFAVQIAKSFGAEVTAVSQTRNLEKIRSIGADHVIDYTHDDFTKGEQRYDLIFDCFAQHSLSACRRVLNPRGIYVAAGGPMKGGGIGLLGRLTYMLVVSWLTSQKLLTFLAQPRKEDLNIISELMATGKVRPVIDRCFQLSQVAAAMRYLEEGRAHGKVVITMGSPNECF